MYSRDEIHKLPSFLQVPVGVKFSDALRDPGTFRPYGGGAAPSVREIHGRFPAFVVQVSSSTNGPPGKLLSSLGGGGTGGLMLDNLDASEQLWVHVDDNAYEERFRQAGLAAPGSIGAKSLVYDHVMNRATARELGYTWLRLCPISRAVNSSGAQYEKFVNQDVRAKRGSHAGRLDRLPAVSPIAWMNPADRASDPVMYAGWVEIAKMLNMRTGGGPAQMPSFILQLMAASGT